MLVAVIASKKTKKLYEKEITEVVTDSTGFVWVINFKNTVESNTISKMEEYGTIDLRKYIAVDIKRQNNIL